MSFQLHHFFLKFHLSIGEHRISYLELHMPPEGAQVFNTTAPDVNIGAPYITYKVP